MRRWSTATGAVLLALSGVLSPASAQADRATVVVTSESECLEFGEITQITAEHARQLIPSRYTIREAEGSPGMVNVYLADYSCDAISVNGGRTQPTMITMAAVDIAERDGVPLPLGTLQPLWWGTDQPALMRALRQLGAPVRQVTGTRSSTPMENGMSLVHNTYSGSRVDHQRVAVVADISAEPVQSAVTPTAYYPGTRGEIQFAYTMEIREKEDAANSILVSGPRSDLVQVFGFPNTLTSKNTLLVGKWSMRAELVH